MMVDSKDQDNMVAELLQCVEKYQTDLKDEKPFKVIKCSSREETIENLRAQLTQMSQERDSALEMWSFAESEAVRIREELMNTHTTNTLVELMKKQMNDMRQDYTDAITLLETKHQSTLGELRKYKEINDALKNEMDEIQTRATLLESEYKSVLSKIDQIKLEREDLQKALEHCHIRIAQAEKMEAEAREKLREAISMAQVALKSEANAAEEKARLETAMSALIEEARVRVGNEVEVVKKSLGTKLNNLAEQLNLASMEKNRITQEYEAKRAEWTIKLKQSKEKNDSLLEQLQEIQSRRQVDVSQYIKERDVLRKQIVTLQSGLEQIPILQKQYNGLPCQKCFELQICISKYKALAEKYRKTAEKLSEDFEMAMKQERQQWRKNYNKLLLHKLNPS